MNSPSSSGPLSKPFPITLKVPSTSFSLARPIFLTRGHKAFSTRLCHKLELNWLVVDWHQVYGICRKTFSTIQRSKALKLAFQRVPGSLGMQPSLGITPSSPQQTLSEESLVHHTHPC